MRRGKLREVERKTEDGGNAVAFHVRDFHSSMSPQRHDGMGK
jgi:hypothetical protein